MKEAWIRRTWDADGRCLEWADEPEYHKEYRPGLWMHKKGAKHPLHFERPDLDHKRGGPRAIRRIEEKP